MATIAEALGGNPGETIMEALGGHNGDTIADVVLEKGVTGTKASTPKTTSSAKKPTKQEEAE